jgi:signal peptidase I
MTALESKQPPPPDYILQAALQVWDQAGGKHFIPIKGRSMLPLIQEGDQVLVIHGCADVRPGDIVVFRQEGTLVAHRVMRIQYDEMRGEVFVTRGDNVLHFDPPVNADEIVGRVLAVKRGGQTMSLATPFWRIVGKLMVAVTLPVANLYYWTRNFKHRFWGSQSHPLAASLRRGGLVLSSVSLKIIQMIYHWKR